MKKLLSLLALTAMLALPASAAMYNVQSFINGNAATSLIVSNGLQGITNLNYIAQNQLQGLYQIGTNTLGTGFNAPIATNYANTMYTNSTPATWYGILYPGSLTFLTNNTVPAGANTNDVQYTLLATNNTANLLQDVNLPQDQYPALLTDNGQPGAAGQTNSIGYIQIVSQGFSLYGQAAGGASNIVSLGFVPIAHMRSPNPGNIPGSSAIPGFSPGWEPTDAAVSGGAANSVWTVTYTNQISTIGTPTVVNVPVPRWKFPGASGIRLRWIYTGTSTNAIAINSITYQNWIN